MDSQLRHNSENILAFENAINKAAGCNNMRYYNHVRLRRRI